MIDQSLRNKKILCTDGFQLRDFLYIDDVTDLIFKVINNNKSRGEIFNIGFSKPIEIKSVINKIVKKTGSGIPIFGAIKIRKDEISIMYPSISKAKKILKWSPKISFSIGLNKTIKSYLT